LMNRDCSFFNHKAKRARFVKAAQVERGVGISFFSRSRFIIQNLKFWIISKLVVVKQREKG
jgi:hypothetical protein